MSDPHSSSSVDLEAVKAHYGAELHICVERSDVAPFSRDTNADFQWLVAEVERLQAQIAAQTAVVERMAGQITLWRQAGEAWAIRAPIVEASERYMRCLAQSQREALGDDYEAIIAEMEQSTTGSQKLCAAKTQLLDALARLDVADVPAAPPHEPSSGCVDTCDNPMVCRDLYDAWIAASTTREETRVSECEFSIPSHEAGYAVTDEGDEDAIERPCCEQHLGGMVAWRFVNHAEGVRVTKVSDASV